MEQVIFGNIYVFSTTVLNQHICNNNHKKGGHEFEREQGGVHGRVLREEREGRNDVIIL